MVARRVRQARRAVLIAIRLRRHLDPHQQPGAFLYLAALDPQDELAENVQSTEAVSERLTLMVVSAITHR